MPFDFTPAFTHASSFHPDFTNQEFVQALNDEYNLNTDYWDKKLPKPFKPSFDPTGLWQASITLSTWNSAQVSECNFAGCSESNPFAVPFSFPQKAQIISSLGFSCNGSDMLTAYDANRTRNISLMNTYYNLGKGEKSFTWENGGLCISDKYNFDGIGDFGAGDGITLAVTFLITSAFALRGTVVAVTRGILESLGADLGPSDPFGLWKRKSLTIGNVRPIFLKNCFTPQELCANNDLLYICAVKSGKIDFDLLSECFSGTPCVEVGQAQPSPILGLPSYAPNVMEITTDEGSLSFGGSSGYPSPFTSFSQQLVNATNLLGAYAMLGDLPGRLVIITSGEYIGELGFTCQNWYNFNDGNFARDANGDLYPTKAQWWETCLKSEMTVKFLPFSERPQVKVMVATKSFSDNNSPEVFSANYPIIAAPIASISLTSILAALPAATLTLI